MEVFTAAQMKEIDRIAIQERGIPSTRLMERAAAGVAEEAIALLRERGGSRVTILCGPGNNGGDGVAAARLLRRAGMEVRAFLAGRREKMTADTLEMERRLALAGGRLEDLDPSCEEQAAWFRESHLFLDALLGVGLHGPVAEGSSAALGLGVLRDFGAGKTVAVDLPSGVEADSGRLLGEAPFCLSTVTFTAPKAGHFLGEGGLRTGRLKVVDIGIPAGVAEPLGGALTAVDGDWVRAALPHRPEDGHKGTFGKVLILGGSVGYTGAPVLAARGALRCGAGLVHLAVPEPIYPIVAVKCDEVMPAPLPAGPGGALSEGALAPLLERMEGKDALLVGPGLGRSAGAEGVIRAVITYAPMPLVLDADGLNALEGHIHILDQRRDRITVLTPHDGEFARLGGDLSGGDRLAAARAFAQAHGCILVLKGHRTITALPDGRACLNTTGNCGMAKGGSGDILGGMILSLLGQGLPPDRAAAAAVWLHGRAGDLCAGEKGRYGMTPTDLVEKVPQAIFALLGE